MKKTIIPLLVGLCVLVSGPVQAQEQALLITSETLDKQAKSTLNRVYITKDKVVVENEDEKNPTTTLFDAKKEELYLIDHKRKEYTLMTKADMQEMSAQLKAATEQMEQQMQQLPAEQRKMMQEQMAKIMGAQEPLTYKQEGSTVPVKGWSTTRYEGRNKEQLRHEIYIATYKELGQDKEDFDALLSLYTLMHDQLKQMSRSMPGVTAFSMQNMPGGEEGLPVKSIYYDAQGKPEITSSINSIEEATLAADKAQVPAKYKQKKFKAGR